MAATFVNRDRGTSVRVAARDTARDVAARLVPEEPDRRRAQIVGYRGMAEEDLLKIEPIIVGPAWLERPRVRVACEACGEGVNYQREVRVRSRVLCRACAGGRYYVHDTPRPGLAAHGA